MDTAASAFDPVAYLVRALEELDACAARAADAARENRAGGALAAARSMQSLLIGRREVLRQIEELGRSERTAPEVREALRATVRTRLLSIERHVARLKNVLDARLERAEALRDALCREATTHAVYARRGGSGADVVRNTVRHIVALSA